MNLTAARTLKWQEFDYNAQMAYMAQIRQSSIDIMNYAEKLYQTLKIEPFADLED